MKKMILILCFFSLSAHAVQVAMFCGAAKESKDARMVDLSVVGDAQNPMLFDFGHQITDHKVQLTNDGYLITPKAPSANAQTMTIATCKLGRTSVATLVNGQLVGKKMDCICSVY